jgi:hypothetical protein
MREGRGGRRLFTMPMLADVCIMASILFFALGEKESSVRGVQKACNVLKKSSAEIVERDKIIALTAIITTGSQEARGTCVLF